MAAGLAIVLYAKDLERLTGFYAAVLDVPVARREPSVAVLDGTGWQVLVHAVPEPYAAEIELTDPPLVRHETPIKPVLPVADLERARAAADRFGGRVHGPEREWTYQGSARCDGVDPEGNVFQLSMSR